MTDVSVFALPETVAGARSLAQVLGVPLSLAAIHRFPDGEIKVTATAAASRVIVYAPLDHPNEKLLALLFASEALRRQGAQRLVLVAPYMCYMRQDTAFQPGEAISQRVVGKLLADAFDRVVTVDAHLHRVKRIADVFTGIEAEDISAVPAIAGELAARAGSAQTIIVGPDEESEGWVRDLARRLGLPHGVARKIRRGDRHVEIAVAEPERFAHKDVILLDDMISSGGTIIACAKALREAGAANIDVVVTHALFDEATAHAFAAAGIRTVRSTDSVPHASNSISLAPILAQVLHRELGALPQLNSQRSKTEGPT